MKTILPGTMYFGPKIDLHCILGSCVGIVIESNNMIGITHGTNPNNTIELIECMFRNFPTSDNIILVGGMKGMGKIGRANIKAAKKALHNIKHKDMTGNSCKIVVRDGMSSIVLL